MAVDAAYTRKYRWSFCDIGEYRRGNIGNLELGSQGRRKKYAGTIN
jgi:hypothetical protein